MPDREEPNVTKPRDIVKAARAQERQDRLAALRDGRRQRAQVFRPKKGRGSYSRKPRRSYNSDP